MFDFLFRKKKRAVPGLTYAATPSVHALLSPSEPAKLGRAAPGTQIRYDPKLVVQLKHEHQALLNLFVATQSAFMEEDLHAVVAHLEAFRIAIQSHLLKESVRLYIYLEHQLAGDETSYQMVHDFRYEMDGIGKAVTGFLNKYKNLDTDINLVASFGPDLDAVGKVLVSRIQREEATLYPLYAPGY